MDGASGNYEEENGVKTKDLYTELNPSDKPESVLRDVDQQQTSSNTSALPSSKFTSPLPTQELRRSRRYKHRRSKSHENYSKIVSPRHSPHVERVRRKNNTCIINRISDGKVQKKVDTFIFIFLQHCMTPQTPQFTSSLMSSFRASTLMTTIETQTEESSFAESLNSTGIFSSRQLHLNIPTSPSANYHPPSDDKVTDMSLGSEASSSKTPGGYEAYHKQKGFSTSTLEEEEHVNDSEATGVLSQKRQTIMKRSVSSTLDEEEEDDDLLDDEDPRLRNSSNNNNEYHNGESSDDMLENLEGAVGQLWEGKNRNGRRRTCRCNCHMHHCHAPKLGVAGGNNVFGGVLTAARKNNQLNEVDEDEAYLDEENHTTLPTRDYGRSESNETLDSKDTNSSSREDVFGDGFETFSDEESIPRHDINDFLKRRS